MSVPMVVNFSCLLTDDHLQEIARLEGRRLPRDQLIELPQETFDMRQPFTEQAEALVARVPFDSGAWQTTPLIVNLPALAPIAAVVLAIISGKRGYLPTILCMEPMREGSTTIWTVAELIDLDRVRAATRKERLCGCVPLG